MASKDQTATTPKPRREPPKGITVPRDLFFTWREALRAVGRDTRGKDGGKLDPITIEKVHDSIDGLDKWSDSKL